MENEKSYSLNASEAFNTTADNIILSFNNLLKEKSHIIAAIDGDCCSGKTTLAEYLGRQLNANVIHIDDFFLPKEMRTPQRFAEAGGNIHRERLLEEVIIPASCNKDLCYKVFSCKAMDYIKAVNVKAAPITIIEGSYSMQPAFLSSYDFKIFMQCRSEIQLSRLKMRESPDRLPDFINKWIPKEKAYFKACTPQKFADIIVKIT